MKKGIVAIFICSLLYASAAFGACSAGSATDADCALWEGSWNITLEGNQSATWDINYTTTTETGASYIKCLAKGTQKQSGKEDVLFQIIWLTFDSSYHYYPTQGALTPGDAGTKINLCKDGQSFTVTNTSPVGILSGVKVPSCIDADGDGYGEGCAAGNDCDDTDKAINPGAQEVCDDGKDNDCDQSFDCSDTDCANEPMCQPCVITIHPTSVKARKMLPRLIVLTITGSGAGFDSSHEVIFDGAAITKLFQTAQGSDKILVIGLLKPGTSGTTVMVSVDGCGSAEFAIE